MRLAYLWGAKETPKMLDKEGGRRGKAILSFAIVVIVFAAELLRVEVAII